MQVVNRFQIGNTFPTALQGFIPAQNSMASFLERAAQDLSGVAARQDNFIPMSQLAQMAYGDRYSMAESEAAQFFCGNPRMMQTAQDHDEWSRNGHGNGSGMGPGLGIGMGMGTGRGESDDRDAFEDGGFHESYARRDWSNNRRDGLSGQSLDWMQRGGARGVTPDLRSNSPFTYPHPPSQQFESAYPDHAKNISRELNRVPEFMDKYIGNSRMSMLTHMANGQGTAAESAREMLANKEWMQRLTGADNNFTTTDMNQAAVSPDDSQSAQKVARYLMNQKITGSSRDELRNMAREPMRGTPADKVVPVEIRNALKQLLSGGGFEAIETLGTRGADNRVSTSQFEMAARVNGYRIY